MEFYSATKKNEILLFSGKWIEFEDIIVSEFSQDIRPKASCFPSFADCRSKTNVAILWDISHTKGRLCKGGIEQENKTKNLNGVDVIHCTGMNIEILNWLGAPWEVN
jgi:hypothetical protein